MTRVPTRRMIQEISELHDELLKRAPEIGAREAWGIAAALWQARHDLARELGQRRRRQRELQDPDDDEEE